MRLTRGYIMLEAMMAGGIVAVGLGTTMTLIAGARFDSSMAARRAEASAWAMTVADSVMATTSTDGYGLTEVEGHNGLRASVAIEDAGGVAGASVPAIPSPLLRKVVVTVEFSTARGKQQLVYERLRRSAP